MPRLLSHGLFPHPPASLSPVCRRTRGTGYTIPGGTLFFLSSLFPRLLPGPFPPSAKGREALGTLPQVGRSLPPMALSSLLAVRAPLRLPERVGCLLSSDLLLRLLPGPFPPPAKGHEALSTLPQMGRFLPPMVLSPPPAVRTPPPPAGGLGAQGTLSRALCLLPPADPFPRPPSESPLPPAEGARGGECALSDAAPSLLRHSSPARRQGPSPSYRRGWDTGHAFTRTALSSSSPCLFSHLSPGPLPPPAKWRRARSIPNSCFPHRTRALPRLSAPLLKRGQETLEGNLLLS